MKPPPTRSVRLTAQECWLILYAMNIAAVDGSVFGAAQPGDRQYERIDTDLNHIALKLKLARFHLGVPCSEDRNDLRVSK